MKKRLRDRSPVIWLFVGAAMALIGVEIVPNPPLVAGVVTIMGVFCFLYLLIATLLGRFRRDTVDEAPVAPPSKQSEPPVKAEEVDDLTTTTLGGGRIQ